MIPVANLPPGVSDISGKLPLVSMIPVVIEDFFHLPPVSTTPVVHLELQIFPRFFKIFEMAQMGYSGAWEKLQHEKT
jgi:hypothetical protein